MTQSFAGLPSRRTLLTLPSLTACTAPFPTVAPNDTTATHPLLTRSAEAHGLARYRTLTDITLRYEGTWAPLIGRIQPLLVDQRFRGPSTERIRPREGTIEQHHEGPAGRKHVLRRPNSVDVAFNDAPATDEPRRAGTSFLNNAISSRELLQDRARPSPNMPRNKIGLNAGDAYLR